MSGSKSLRHLLARAGLVEVAGAHDALSAYLADRHGFDAVWASGLGISAARCVPDASILTMTEFLAAAAAMVEACSIPVIADCDTGFGGPANIARLVREYEQKGIAGICLEDKVFPKRNSFMAGHDLADPQEFSASIELVKQVQVDPNFVVIARVESLIAGAGLSDALSRGLAYAEAGADAVLIHSKAPTPAEVTTFAERWAALPHAHVPIVVVPTTYPDVTGEALADSGVKIVIYANQALRASVAAMEQTLGAIRQRSSADPGPDISLTSIADLFSLIGTDSMVHLEEWHAERVASRRVLPTVMTATANGAPIPPVREMPTTPG
jgi:phosphoenolpyruvate phosphomutase